MTLARIISIGVTTMVASAIGIASTYAENPCCTIQNGVWIVTKTGKPASPTQIRTMQTSQPPTSVKVDAPPKPAGGAATGTGGGGGGSHK
jgi:hypothetical protein